MNGRRANSRRTNPRRGAAPAATRLPGAGLIVGLVVGLIVVAGGVALAGEQAPRRPPEPIPVFVHAMETADAELEGMLAQAVAEVGKRIARRRHWFRTVDSAEQARVTLLVTNYRTASQMIPKLDKLIQRGQVVMVERSEIIELHFVDAVAGIGGVTETLSGLDERETGTSLRNASDNLAEQLERFCRDHYAALSESSP